MIGRTITHYRVTERLGRGGMGEVYLAEDTRLGRQVALKFVPASYNYDADRKSRFLQEARALSSLNSANIAMVYDIGEYEGSSFIVIEYVKGETLASRLSKGPIPFSDAVDIVLQVGSALVDAHRAGIVHRDIKSSNIMLAERGLVKLLDFGLAQSIEPRDAESHSETAQQTVADIISGTVNYLSPEQALGRRVDGRSDLFSLGVVLYEMLAGRLPFDGASSVETIDMILHQEPPPITRFNSRVSPVLERISRRLLAKNPDSRYQTALELINDIKGARQTGRDSGVIGPGGGLSDESKTVILPRLGAVPASRPAASQVGTLSAGPPPTPRIAVIVFSNITGEAGDNWIGSGISETVTADLKNIHGLSVIGRERIYEVLKSYSSGTLADVDERFAIEIGRRLGAAWIITGGYQRVGELIRITAGLLSVETGMLIKSVKIDGRLSDIFDLQDRIVFDLSHDLDMKLASSERLEIERDETDSVEAYEDFSRAMIDLRMATRDSLDRAIAQIEKAIDRDPNYARAWAARAVAYTLKGSFLSIPELSQKAIEFGQRAVALNPRLAEAHQWLASAYLNRSQYDEAFASIREAIRLEPANSMAHATLGRIFWIGKGLVGEAMEELDQSIVLNPEAGYSYLQLSFLHSINNDFRAAEAVARKAVELQDQRLTGTQGLNMAGARTRLGYALYRQGRYDEAIAEYQVEIDFFLPGEHVLRDRSLIELFQKQGAAYLRKGMAAEAEARFAKAAEMFEHRIGKGADDPFTRYYAACLYSLQNRPEPALESLGHALGRLRRITVLRATTDPDLDNLRDHPQFKEMLVEPEAAARGRH